MKRWDGRRFFWNPTKDWCTFRLKPWAKDVLQKLWKVCDCLSRTLNTSSLVYIGDDLIGSDSLITKLYSEVQKLSENVLSSYCLVFYVKQLLMISQHSRFMLKNVYVILLFCVDELLMNVEDRLIRTEPTVKYWTSGAGTGCDCETFTPLKSIFNGFACV